MGVPYCIIAQVAFGSHLRTMRVPEEWIPRVTQHGWIVLIRDTEMPIQGETFSWRDLQSGAQRQAFRTDLDVNPEGEEGMLYT